MNRKLLFGIGAVVLFVGAGFGTYSVLAAITPQKVTSTSDSNEATNSSYGQDSSSATSNDTGSNTSSSPDSTVSTDETAVATSGPTNPASTDANTAGVNDSSVKNIVAQTASGFTNYSANNRGTLPSTQAQMTNFASNYLSNVDLTNPATGAKYTIGLNSAASSEVISFNPQKVCVAENNSQLNQGTARQFALVVTLPSGALYCASY